MRGKQPNLSYFAFTATPKSPTLKLFGTWDPERVNPHDGEQGMHVPFHVYSMRQAIEEGYILDVLANYLTYETKWRLRNAAVQQQDSQIGNPDVDERKAKAKLVRLALQHPTSLAQKAKLIVEDFRESIARRLGGRVEGDGGHRQPQGRARALPGDPPLRRPPRAGPRRARRLLGDSSRTRPPGPEFTEAQLNGFPETRLPDRFGYAKADDPQAAARDQDEYRLLVVAEKYQTGFDQPLLCGMYVDKKLDGVAAVQTLSRLNRIHPLKSQDDVRVSTSSTRPTDPGAVRALVRDDHHRRGRPEHPLRMQRRSCTTGGGRAGDGGVPAAAGRRPPGTCPASAEKTLHAKLHQYLQPAIDRFAALETDDQRKDFRGDLRSYVRAYSLFAQVIDWGDPDLERLYQYGANLLLRLPGEPSVKVDIGDADLSHFRLEHTGSTTSRYRAGDVSVRGHAADGGAPRSRRRHCCRRSSPS